MQTLIKFDEFGHNSSKLAQINIKNRGTKMNFSCPGLSCPPNLSQVLNFGKNRTFEILNPSENPILDP